MFVRGALTNVNRYNVYYKCISKCWIN